MRDSILQFKQKLMSLAQISDSSLAAFTGVLKQKSFGKNEDLITCGQVEDNINFIISGLVKVFVMPKDREICTAFRFENQFTSSVTSFYQQTKSSYTITALVETKVLQISHSDLNQLYNDFDDINRLGRVLLERILIEKRKRELDFLLLTAEERYHKLVFEYPEYIQQIPLKSLASFLGIRQASLSRIRAKSIKKLKVC